MIRCRTLAGSVGLDLFMTAAQAHTGTDIAGGFASGSAHPVHGLDHVVAMVAVGLWGAFLGRTAIWVLPVGRVLGVDDIISFHGESVAESESSFQSAVDAYIAAS